MSFKRLKYYIIFFFIIITYNNVYSEKTDLKIKNICVINQKRIKKNLIVEIADTRRSRTKGLMYRKKLDYNKGMLFVFKNEKYLNFWMKNVTIPLSIAFIDKNGIIKDIKRMKPLDISITYPSKCPVKFALEVNQGWFKKNRIKEGNRVIFNGCLGK